MKSHFERTAFEPDGSRPRCSQFFVNSLLLTAGLSGGAFLRIAKGSKKRVRRALPPVGLKTSFDAVTFAGKENKTNNKS